MCARTVRVATPNTWQARTRSLDVPRGDHGGSDSRRLVDTIEARPDQPSMQAGVAGDHSIPLGHNVGHIVLQAQKSPRACSRASGSPRI